MFEFITHLFKKKPAPSIYNQPMPPIPLFVQCCEAAGYVQCGEFIFTKERKRKLIVPDEYIKILIYQAETIYNATNACHLCLIQIRRQLVDPFHKYCKICDWIYDLTNGIRNCIDSIQSEDIQNYHFLNTMVTQVNQRQDELRGLLKLIFANTRAKNPAFAKHNVFQFNNFFDSTECYHAHILDVLDLLSYKLTPIPNPKDIKNKNDNVKTSSPNPSSEAPTNNAPYTRTEVVVENNRVVNVTKSEHHPPSVKYIVRRRRCPRKVVIIDGVEVNYIDN